MASIRDTGCCGASFEREEISIIALLTLAVPYLALYGALWPLLRLLALVPPLGRTVDLLAVVAAANIKAVSQSRLWPRLRCDLSGRLFQVSPRLSGLVFRAFNFVVLGAIWSLVLGLAAGVWLLAA